MTQLPPDLQAILDQIDSSARAGEALAAAVDDRQFHWQPAAGLAWSIAQCLEHIGRINQVYTTAARVAVEQARVEGWRRRGPIALTWIGAWFARKQEPPARLKMRAPGLVQPQSSSSRDDVLRIFRDGHARMRALVEHCADIDVNRATFANPFVSFVHVRVGTALHALPAHDRRHLWQAEQVRKAADFPAASPASRN